MVIRAIPAALLSLLIIPALISRPVFGGDLLSYKPYSEPLEYNLRIKSHAVIDSDFGRSEEAIVRDHLDALTLKQQVNDAGEGLLNISTTVKKINVLPPGPSFEKAYKRQEIVGSTQQIKINLQGKVIEADVIPHFGSRAFWLHGEDGPPLDIYNIFLLMNPRFPLGRLDIGSTWEIEDKIELGLADIPPISGEVTLTYNLEMTVRQKIKYHLIS